MGDFNTNAHYGFCAECKSRMSIQIYRQMNTMFSYMPVAATVGGKLFCVHGGIGPSIQTLDDIRRLQDHLPLKVVLNPPQEWEANLQDLLWADPCDDDEPEDKDFKGFSFNFNRKISVMWNKEATDTFLATTGLQLVVRAHELVQGYTFTHDGKVLTIFSSSDYCGQRNTGAAVHFTGDTSSLSVWEIDAEHKPIVR